MRSEAVSTKTKVVLKVILSAFLIIALRVWHLEVIQREDKKRDAEHPKRRTIVQRADRGTILDRHNNPLAVNKICYNATIYYNQISQVPAISWKDVEGKRVRVYPRRDYIQQLSLELGHLLKLDPVRVEDLIHSKASLFPHVPFVIKSGLSEEEHFRLALIEKDWLGVHAEIASERFYPKGRIGGEIIGSMGCISSREYLSIAEEIKQLETKAQEEGEIGQRYLELKEKAYTIQDLVGKTGIEGRFEQQLRGFYGKKIFEVDPKGKFLKEKIGGHSAIPGQQINLTLSIELQEFAEALLAENEALRDGRSMGFDPQAKERKVLKQPWIKGGSIVAMDPNTGEILAMASTPRFDPNDFIPSSNEKLQTEKQRNVSRWLENDRLVASIWDGRQDLIRERFTPKKGFYEEARPLTWERYLEILLPTSWSFLAHCDVKTAIQVQEDFETLLFCYKMRDALTLLEKLYPRSTLPTEPDALAALKRLDLFLIPLSNNGDRLLAIDLCRLAVYAPAFTDESVALLGTMKLGHYRTLNQTVCKTEDALKEEAKKLFRETEFKTWRETHQKTFLAEKRALEKLKKSKARPYIDYLDQKEQELFQLYWNERRLDALAESFPSFGNKEQCKAALHTFRSFADLERPLLGSYKRVRKHKNGEQIEKHLAASFYPLGGFGYSNSYAFQGTAAQGSIFKLVTGYAALAQTNGENPLLLIDEQKRDPRAPAAKSQIVASAINGTPYYRIYKGGRLPRSSSPIVGKIDLIGAIERTSNPYFSLLASDVLKNPEDLVRAASLFGFGSHTGIDLPGEAKGKLPDDLSYNRTGLYSTAIGQHKLLVTPLQTAVMLSTIANGGRVLKPHLEKETIGGLPNLEPLGAFDQLAPDELRALGISFPLFTAAVPRSETTASHSQEKETVRTIYLPPKIRSQLLEGMDRVLWTNKGTARSGLIRGLHSNPALLSGFLSLSHQVGGKTGTAEVLFNPNINPSNPAYMYKHIWFGAIAFDGDPKIPHAKIWDHPELVVVVYLRYGDAGKEAAPLATQVIQKWREIKNRSK